MKVNAIEIVRRCQQDPRDRAAWDALYRLFYPYVLVHARAFRLPSTPLGEEDVVQEVFLKLIEHFPQVKFENERHFRAYLRRICENYMVDLVRKYEKQTYEQITGTLRVSTGEASPEQVVAYSEERELLMKAVAQLPSRCRLLLEDFVARGKSLAEIAREQGIPLGTIYPRFSRCVAELRRIAPKEFRPGHGTH